MNAHATTSKQAQHSNANAPQKRKQISLMPLVNWKSLSNLESAIDPGLPRRLAIAINAIASGTYAAFSARAL